MKVIVSVNPPPSSQLSTAPAATQRLSSPTTFWKVVPSESPPTTKPHSSQDFSGLEKIWDFYSNIRGEPWKIYHLFICFISWDESVLHLKNSSLIQATRQGFLQVEFTQRWSTPFLRYKGICLGFQTFDWDIGKLHKKKGITLAKFRACFRKIPFQKPYWKCDPFRFLCRKATEKWLWHVIELPTVHATKKRNYEILQSLLRNCLGTFKGLWTSIEEHISNHISQGKNLPG